MISSYLEIAIRDPQKKNGTIQGGVIVVYIYFDVLQN